ncbi:MAG: peptidylprolyl isomerase [Candidatus Marinimicrobia bacterium]|nr:peptidylprolyl isomerase [Candidatus Neomarinimicrobiota bacterium]
MGLMTSMREKMHVVLWALLAMFILSMTIGGLVGGANVLDILAGNVDPRTTIAQINGEDISPDYFNQLVSQQLEQARSNGQKLNDFQIRRARDTAWDNMLQDVLVSQEVKRLNISASNEEVMYHLENNPPPFLQQNPSFQTDGVFDWDKYRTALASPQGDEWLPIESFMKNTYVPNFKLQKLLDESIIITERNIKNEFIKRNVNYTISGIHITSGKVPVEESEPSDSEIREEYNKSKSDFKHDELRSVSYVSWKKEPAKNDSVSVQKLATAIYERAKEGEEFATLANEYSVDPGNQGTKGGDLGWFGKGQMVKEFEKAAFTAKKGEIIEPVKSNFGYHIIYVRDKKVENGEEKVLASHILLKIEISSTTLSNLKRDATLFSYDAQDNGFSSAVSEHNLDIVNHKKMNDEGFSIKGLGGLRAAVRFAFNNKVGDVSDILENDQYFSVFTLDTIISPGFKSYEEVQAQIKSTLKKTKVMAATLDEANKLLLSISGNDMKLDDAIDDDSELDAVKNESKQLVQGFTSIGRSNYVTGALLAAKPGEILGPLETARGHAIIELKEISVFDSTEYEVQKESIRKTIFNQKQNQFFQAWLDDLKENAEIVDNRKFYF